MPAAEAAKQILDGVRRNYAEFSVPGYLLYLGHVLRYVNITMHRKGSAEELARIDALRTHFQDTSKGGIVYVARFARYRS